MTGVRDYSTGELKHNVRRAGQAAKAAERCRIVVTTTGAQQHWGPTFPELVEHCWLAIILGRPSTLLTIKGRAALTANRPQEAIFAGTSLEVCAAFPRHPAIGRVLEAYVAVDAVRNASARPARSRLLRMLRAAGVILFRLLPR